ALSNTRLFQRDLMELCPDGDATCLRQAGLTAVPRILARPSEAATLLSRAAALLPVMDAGRLTAEALIAQATTLLSQDPAHPQRASCKLAYIPSLGCSTNAKGPPVDGALDVLRRNPLASADLLKTLDAARSLLPDDEFPGNPGKLLAPRFDPTSASQ